MAVNYGGNKTRFIAPVRSGQADSRPLETARNGRENAPGQWQQTVEITLEIEGEDKPGSDLRVDDASTSCNSPRRPALRRGPGDDPISFSMPPPRGGRIQFDEYPHGT